ncbi:ParA family protein [Rhabdochlamydiaceae symbiont of Dictyostelium giganteum]|uniref:ParA family protein n=1 Tax=Rhabdochlamydiaceae symbiont of Dictyostelium giganteum TaxID=3342349 RepID=UPI00384FE831
MPIITVSSFKGGTAKTSSSLNLGAALALFHDQNVLLIDFDAQANLTAGLGYDPDAQESLAPVLQGKKRIEEVILSTNYPKLSLIAADTWLERVEVTQALAADRYSHEKLRDLLKPLKQFDTIIIDTPPSLCWLTESALIASQFALIAATPEFYSVKGLQRLSQFLESLGTRHSLEVLGVILSFWNPRGKSNDAFLEVIEETFPGKMLKTKIRRDVAVSESSIYGKSIFDTAPKSRAAQDFIKLSSELLQRL